MKIKLNSFRTKILLALVVVISLVTFSAFYLYNKKLNELVHLEHDNSVISVLNLLKEQFYHTLGTNEGKIIYTLLDYTRLNPHVENAYLLNSKNEVIYPSLLNSTIVDSLKIKKFSAPDSSITVESLISGVHHFTRAYIPLQNSAECYACHSPSIKSMGTIVVDIKEGSLSKSVNFTKSFSIVFTLIMLLIIGGTVLIMHYKFVKSALKEFHLTIDSVNRGEIHKRLLIPKTQELGKLSISFNTMLDNFQNAQKELQVFHTNELRNNHKLVTIGEMSSRLAHEIRNPITGIANAIEIIQTEISDDKLQEVLEEILRQANRVNKSISQLLKYSKQKHIELTAGDLNKILKHLQFFFKNQSFNKDIVFKTYLQENIPLVKFDAIQLEDVFLNIGLNAIHSIEKIGTIVFRSSFIESENSVLVSITDTGKGINDEVLPKIFTPFYTTKHEGTGLGLAIAKDIIDKHNGEIWAENNPDQGCTFFIKLPV